MKHNGQVTESTNPESPQDLAAERWRLRMLPAMRGSLVAMALFFFLATLVQYHLLYQDLRQGATLQRDAVAMLDSLGQEDKQPQSIVEWKTLVLLEQEVLRMRYQQINATLLLRTWTRQTGFLVGMVLAITGAFFILGRLKEEQSEVSGESAGMKVMLTTSSPGIVLAMLGTILMLVTLTVKFDYQVDDRPVYLGLHLLGTANLPSESPGVNRAATEPVTSRPKPPLQQMQQARPIGPDDPPIPPGEKTL